MSGAVSWSELREGGESYGLGIAVQFLSVGLKELRDLQALLIPFLTNFDGVKVEQRGAQLRWAALGKVSGQNGKLTIFYL